MFELNISKISFMVTDFGNKSFKNSLSLCFAFVEIIENHAVLLAEKAFILQNSNRVNKNSV